MLARTQFRGKHTQTERFDCMLARTLRGKKHRSESFECILARTQFRGKDTHVKALTACLHKRT
jgi:hypothetical protein